MKAAEPDDETEKSSKVDQFVGTHALASIFSILNLSPHSLLVAERVPCILLTQLSFFLQSLPSVFSGLQVFVSEDMKDVKKLKRYIIAYPLK